MKKQPGKKSLKVNHGAPGAKKKKKAAKKSPAKAKA